MLHFKEKFFQKRLTWFNPEALPPSTSEKNEKKKDSAKISPEEKPEAPYEKTKRFIAKLEASGLSNPLKEAMDGYVRTHLEGVAKEAYEDKINQIITKNGDKALTIQLVLEDMQDVYLNQNPGMRGRIDQKTGLPEGIFDELFRWALHEEPKARGVILKVSDRVKALMKDN